MKRTLNSHKSGIYCMSGKHFVFMCLFLFLQNEVVLVILNLGYYSFQGIFGNMGGNFFVCHHDSGNYSQLMEKSQEKQIFFKCVGKTYKMKIFLYLNCLC